MYSKNIKENRNNLIAEKIADFFFEYWKKQNNGRGNKVAVLDTDCLSEKAYRTTKTATL